MAGWEQLKLPVNEPEDVATAMLICATANRAEAQTHNGGLSRFHGRILFVAGGKSYEIEERLQRLEPQWLGTENSRLVALGEDYLQNGTTTWKQDFNS